MGKVIKNTKWVAHRGFSSREVENTLPAFYLACKEKSFTGVECDVQVTKDGKFVIFHDRDLRRMCGVDFRVKDLTLSELQAYPLFNMSGILDYHYQIPSFEEYISLCKEHNKTCFIEIKSKMSFGQVKQLLEIVKKENYLNKCIFISFHFHCLMALRTLSKDVVLQHVCDYRIKKKGWLCRRLCIGIDYKYNIIKKIEIQKFRALGLTTNAWTIGDKKTADLLVSYNIDYITSNYLF